MYAVIFHAKLKHRDKTYDKTTEALRKLAFEKYGCLDFINMGKDERELSISYWKSKEDIQAWKHDPEHRAAQTLGQTRWYKTYSVQIVKVEKQYSN